MGNNRYGWSIDKGFYGKSEIPPRLKTQPTDLELRIRKEVMDAVIRLSGSWKMIETSKTVDDVALIKDRLNLLWGDK